MIFLILLAALIIRLINLSQSLWLDEAIEVLAVKNNSFWQLISQYSIGDFHPPLYHLILKFWTTLFGYSEIAARMPSVIFGTITCYFVFLIAKKLFSQRTGLLAALFLAVNPLAVYYAQEARMYSLAMLAITASVYFFLEKRWFWHFAFLLIALYTDYLPWLMLPVFFLLTKNKKSYLLSSIFSLLFVLPWLPLLWKQLQNGLAVAQALPQWNQIVGGFDPKALPLTWVKFIIGRISFANKFVYAGIVAPLSLFYLWVVVQTRQKSLWWWLLVPLVLGFSFSLKISVFSYFRFLFVLPAFILLLAPAAARWHVVAVIIILASLGSLAIFNLQPEFQRENWRAAVSYITKDRGLVALPSLAQAAPLYYYDPTLVVLDRTRFNFSQARIVYLVRYVQEIFDPQDVLRRGLEDSGFVRTQEVAFNGVLVWKYVR